MPKVNSFKEEISLYKFIIMNGKQVEYNSVVEHFGEPIWILVQDCIKDRTIEHIKKKGIINGIISITKLGLKKYKRRHYLRFLNFLRLFLNKLNYQIQFTKLDKESKRHITIVVLMILTIFVTIYFSNNQSN